MTEVVLPPNHVSLIIKLLSPYFPKGSVRAEEPSGDRYDAQALMILVKDGGQSAVKDYAFWDCLTSLEVRHGSRSEAKTYADKADALLRSFDELRYIGSLNAPTYDPEPELSVPAYTWTMRHMLRGTPTTVEALRG